MTEPTYPVQFDEVVRVRVPFAIRKRDGRKLIVIDNAMVEAIARAFGWRKLLETGRIWEHS